jgi:hypothetical protein
MVSTRWSEPFKDKIFCIRRAIWILSAMFLSFGMSSSKKTCRISTNELNSSLVKPAERLTTKKFG